MVHDAPGRQTTGEVNVEIRVRKLEKQPGDEGTGTTKRYLVVDGEKEFFIDYSRHPHLGASLSLAGQEGTLHIRTEDNTVIRQLVALGGGCALAVHEEIVEGLSPDCLRAVIEAEQSGETEPAGAKADPLES